MPRLSIAFIFFIGYFLSVNLLANEKAFTLVTDAWPPFVIDNEHGLSGTDVDITRIIFKRLEQPLEIKITPWKRCLNMMKQKAADGILGVSLTAKRKQFLYYPEAPVSEGTTALFTHHKRTFKIDKLSELGNKRTGAILGYSYCDELDNSDFIKRAERVSTLEQNFKKLMANRLDLFVEVESVGLYTAKTMGLDDQITIIPNARFCHGGNYLGFAKTERNQALAQRFDRELSAFKKTAEYSLILKKYGL